MRGVYLREGSVSTVVLSCQWGKDVALDFLFPGAELYLYIGAVRQRQRCAFSSSIEVICSFWGVSSSYYYFYFYFQLGSSSKHTQALLVMRSLPLKSQLLLHFPSHRFWPLQCLVGGGSNI